MIPVNTKVPQVSVSGYQRTEPLLPDPVVKAVDDWLLMERKARAWDDLVRFSKQNGSTAGAIAGRLLELATSQVQESNHGR